MRKRVPPNPDPVASNFAWTQNALIPDSKPPPLLPHRALPASWALPIGGADVVFDQGKTRPAQPHPGRSSRGERRPTQPEPDSENFKTAQVNNLTLAVNFTSANELFLARPMPSHPCERKHRGELARMDSLLSLPPRTLTTPSCVQQRDERGQFTIHL